MAHLAAIAGFLALLAVTLGGVIKGRRDALSLRQAERSEPL